MSLKFRKNTVLAYMRKVFADQLVDFYAALSNALIGKGGSYSQSPQVPVGSERSLFKVLLERLGHVAPRPLP